MHLFIWIWTFTSPVGWWAKKSVLNVMLYCSHHWPVTTIGDFSLRPLCLDLLGVQKPSPFKEVDEFVLTLVCKEGIQGSKQESLSTHPHVTQSIFFPHKSNWMSHLTQTGIRRWNFFASEQLLVYDIEKFRWCHNVKRFHKSNNIMWVSITVTCIALHSLFDGLQQITNALYSSFW